MGHDGDKAEALKPEIDMLEACSSQALLVLLEGVRHQDVLEGGPFLGDLQGAVAVGALEGVVQLGLQVLLVGVGEDDFLLSIVVGLLYTLFLPTLRLLLVIYNNSCSFLICCTTLHLCQCIRYTINMVL